jgi:phosphoglycerol geranylgeranyltransferase
MKTVYERIADMPKPAYFVLIDPDRTGVNDSVELARIAEINGADAILIGSSLMLNDRLDECIVSIKTVVKIPVVIFPGLLNAISPNADALLFLNMISSRNSQFLIGEQVRAAPLIRKCGLETISMAYLLIESGRMTSVQYISNSFPIPRNKPDIVVAHTMAAEMIGMKMIYLEAGSGAEHAVPDEIISQVRQTTSLPIIVGGGIKTPEIAFQKVKAGADIIVTGTVLEDEFCKDQTANEMISQEEKTGKALKDSCVGEIIRRFAEKIKGTKR